MQTTTRVVTGLTPSGRLHIGNYLGAIRPLLALAADPSRDVRAFIVDLHALTVEHDPERLRARTLEVATTLLACGLDPGAALFTQSSVPAHTELSYLLESTASYGEMQRMVQFKEKSATAAGAGAARLSLLTYPALMAADILVHRADVVPVGHDQLQHLELTATLARRFNARYGAVFTVPRGELPATAARVKDLRNPAVKMGKSSTDSTGVVYLRDDADTLVAKVRRAVTDGEPALYVDAAARPGVTNLAELLGALTGRTAHDAVADLRGGAALKAAVADALVATLSPIQARYAELAADPGAVLDRLREGAHRVAGEARQTVAAARSAIGLLDVA